MILRSECDCSCHNGGMLHVFPCCEPDLKGKKPSAIYHVREFTFEHPYLLSDESLERALKYMISSIPDDYLISVHKTPGLVRFKKVDLLPTGKTV